MPSGAITVVAVVAAVALVGLLTRPVLRRLPDWDDDDDQERDKDTDRPRPPYAAVATPRFAACCAALSGVAVVVAALTLPRAVLPMWWVLAVPVLILVAVDARTTWIPRPLVQASRGAMLVATAVTFALSRDGWLVGRAGLGAAAAGAFFLLVHTVSKGRIGFGDVQLAPLLGAATAAVGWSTWFDALLLGSLTGAAYGTALLARRGNRGFAYAPSMLAGAFLACGTRWLAH